MFHLVFFSFFLVILMLYFAFLTHPLSMALNLFIQTLLFSVLIGGFHSSYWLSYLLFLVFLGGLLIVFAYVSTLASNEKFSFSFFYVFAFFLSFVLSLLMIFPIIKNDFFIMMNFFENNDFMVESQSVDLYSFASYVLLYLVVYLLLCLVVVVRISRLEEGPLRSF